MIAPAVAGVLRTAPLSPQPSAKLRALGGAAAVHLAVLALLLAIHSERLPEPVTMRGVEFVMQAPPAETQAAGVPDVPPVGPTPSPVAVPPMPTVPVPSPEAVPSLPVRAVLVTAHTVEPIPSTPQLQPQAQMPEIPVPVREEKRVEPARPPVNRPAPEPRRKVVSRVPGRIPAPHPPADMTAPPHQEVAAALPVQGSQAPSLAPISSVPASSVPARDANGDWRGALMAWLQSHKTYPESARRDGVQGRVVVHFQMDEAGDVRELALVQSSGSGVLDQAALAMLRGAHLPRPPAGTSITLPIRYSLVP